MHKNSLIHISDCSFNSLVFTLTTKVWSCEVNLHQKKKSYLCPSSFIQLEIITAHEHLHSKNHFSPSQIWPEYTSCFANLEAWPDHRTADARSSLWSSPMALLLSCWEQHIPFSLTDTLYQVQASIQHLTGLKWDVFPNTAPSALF